MSPCQNCTGASRSRFLRAAAYLFHARSGVHYAPVEDRTGFEPITSCRAAGVLPQAPPVRMPPPRRQKYCQTLGILLCRVLSTHIPGKSCFAQFPVDEATTQILLDRSGVCISQHLHHIFQGKHFIIREQSVQLFDICPVVFFFSCHFLHLPHAATISVSFGLMYSLLL